MSFAYWQTFPAFKNFILADYAGINCPAVLCNLMDVANSQGKTIDAAKIEERLGIPVVPLLRQTQKLRCLYKAIDRAFKESIINSDSFL